jgi:FAS-associated factor 2
MKLHATTYPLVAFISLYARIDGSDTMTVVTRHSGPPSTITSAETLCGHIVNTVLPRVAPVLNRKHAEKRSRDLERRLREEQDRAYAESQRKDYERIMKRREEERKEREEEERKKNEVVERARRVEERLAWRRYARRQLVPQEIPGSKSAVRIGVRLPSGKQIIRRFERTDSMTSLYAFVASQFIPPEYLPEDDPIDPPSQPSDGSVTDFDEHDWDWEFKLAVAFPKTAISWTKGKHTAIGDVPALKGGANLVVEMERPPQSADPLQDDGDETESEDE